MKTVRKPSWWPLYLLLPLALGLLLLEGKAPFSMSAHRLVESGIVSLTCGLAQVWIRANGTALLEKGPVYTLRYTWLEECQAAQPLVWAERRLTDLEAFAGQTAEEMPSMPASSAFQAMDPDSLRASVLTKN